MSNYYRRTRSRSKEPAATGQNVDVFQPLPSIHQQNRTRFQTGVRPQFGFNDTGASSNFHQEPPRQRLKSHVKEVNPRDLLAANLATSPKSPQKRGPMTERIIKDHRRSGVPATSPPKRARSVSRDDDETPPKRGRGRPPKNQNEPPTSNQRRSTDRQYNPRSAGYSNHQNYSENNRNSPVRNGNRRTDPPMTRARSREPNNRDQHFDDTPRGRSREPEHNVVPRRSTRSTDRQQPTPRNQPSQPRPPRHVEPIPNSQRRSREPRSSARSVEIIDPPPQQPSSSANVQPPAQPLQQARPIERILDNKDPCIASMVVRLYAPGRTIQNVLFAPNIFAYPAIRENVNGGSVIGKIVDTVNAKQWN